MGLFRKKTYMEGVIDWKREGINCNCSGDIAELIAIYMVLTENLIEIIQNDVYENNNAIGKFARISMMNGLFDAYEKHNLKLIDLRENENE